MSNTLPLVNHEQAVMLKEMGFDWKCDNAFSDDADKPFTTHGTNHNYFRHYFSAPTLALAAMWLREKNISVEVRRHIWNGEYLWACDVINIASLKRYHTISKDTHDLALSSGITTALLIVKNKEK